MSITDELRECIKTANRSYEDTRNPYNDREVLHIVDEELLAIADRIDEQYNRTCRALDSAWSATAHEVLVQTIGELSDEWVKLPVDADGVPIHVGDYVETLIDAFKGERGRVECLTLTEDGWCVDGDAPSTVRHYHAPTVEDVLREFAQCWDDPAHYAKGELVEQYAAKLRLAGEAE